MGRITLREECIEQIRGLVDMDMAVMDIFDDLYGLCRLLLEIDKEDVFWDIVAVLEKLTKNANIANLQRKIVSLKSSATAGNRTRRLISRRRAGSMS